MGKRRCACLPSHGVRGIPQRNSLGRAGGRDGAGTESRRRRRRPGDMDSSRRAGAKSRGGHRQALRPSRLRLERQSTSAPGRRQPEQCRPSHGRLGTGRSHHWRSERAAAGRTRGIRTRSCERRVADSAAIDDTSDTDGVAVTSTPLPGFPDGLLVVQDGDNPGGNQNFKLVSWVEVRRTLGL